MPWDLSYPTHPLLVFLAYWLPIALFGVAAFALGWNLRGRADRDDDRTN